MQSTQPCLTAPRSSDQIVCRPRSAQQRTAGAFVPWTRTTRGLPQPKCPFACDHAHAHAHAHAQCPRTCPMPTRMQRRTVVGYVPMHMHHAYPCTCWPCPYGHANAGSRLGPVPVMTSSHTTQEMSIRRLSNVEHSLSMIPWCAYVYVHLAYMCIHVHTCACMCMRVCMHTYMCMYVHMYECTCR